MLLLEHPFSVYGGLEAEACLQVNDATTQSRGGLAEVVGRDDVGDAAVGEVEVIEEIEGIDTKLDLRVFAQDRHLGKTKGLGDGCIDVFISGSV